MVLISIRCKSLSIFKKCAKEVFSELSTAMFQGSAAHGELVVNLADADSFCIERGGVSRRFPPNGAYPQPSRHLSQAEQNARAHTFNDWRRFANDERMYFQEFQNQIMAVGAAALREAQRG